MSNLTEDELAGLSDEERAALEDDDESTEGDVVDTDPEPAPDPEPKPEEEPAPEPAPDPNDVDPESKPVDQEPAPGDPEPEPELASAPEDFNPQYKVEAVEDYDGKMTAFAEQKKGLRQQYKDGDLTHDEYEDQREAVDENVIQLREDNLKAQMAFEQNEQNVQQRWQWEQDRFFGQAANKGYKNDPMIESAFDTTVKALGRDEANDGKPMSWYLEEADRLVREKFVVPGAAPAKLKDKADDKGKVEARKPTKPDLSKLPPNLGDLPAAEIPETGDDGEFAYLDKLGGMELEAALANMTPAQETRYLVQG